MPIQTLVTNNDVANLRFSISYADPILTVATERSIAPGTQASVTVVFDRERLDCRSVKPINGIVRDPKSQVTWTDLDYSSGREITLKMKQDTQGNAPMNDGRLTLTVVDNVSGDTSIVRMTAIDGVFDELSNKSDPPVPSGLIAPTPPPPSESAQPGVPSKSPKK